MRVSTGVVPSAQNSTAMCPSTSGERRIVIGALSVIVVEPSTMPVNATP
jgi:hypothetical protein